MPKMAGSKKFKGLLVHSSKLDDVELTGKRVAIVGSGASAVEAAELAVNKSAQSATILARHDKWFIPRNFLVDCLLACQPLGRQTPLSFIPEFLIRKFRTSKEHKTCPARLSSDGLPAMRSTDYRDLEWMSPSRKYGHGLFAGCASSLLLLAAHGG